MALGAGADADGAHATWPDDSGVIAHYTTQFVDALLRDAGSSAEEPGEDAAATSEASAAPRAIHVTYCTLGGNPNELQPFAATALLSDLRHRIAAEWRGQGRPGVLIWRNQPLQDDDMDRSLASVFEGATEVELLVSVKRTDIEDSEPEEQSPVEQSPVARQDSTPRWNDWIEASKAQIRQGDDELHELPVLGSMKIEECLRARGYELPGVFKSIDMKGAGAYGCVMRVQRRRDGAVLALKRQQMGNFDSSSVPILRELSILNELRGRGDEHVVQVRDTFFVNPSGLAEVWTIMEHFPSDLHKELRSFGAEPAARSAVFQILQGLDSLHRRDIVHRDLKPSNVLVDHGPPLRIALCDFGLSRSVRGFAAAPERAAARPPALQRTMTSRVGTSCWAAPEMWGFARTDNMQRQDFKSVDVFALGLIWAQLFACRHVLGYAGDGDPHDFLLLEILKKVDQPAASRLEELGYTDETREFVRRVLSGNMDEIRAAWEGSAAAGRQRRWEEVLGMEITTIDAWIRQSRGEASEEPSPGSIALITRATRFIYRDRPRVRDMIHDTYFEDLRLLLPPDWEAERADGGSEHSCAEALEDPQESLGCALRRLREIRQSRRSSAPATAAAPDLQRTVSEDVREVSRQVRLQVQGARRS